MGGSVRTSLQGYATGMYFDNDSDKNLIKKIIKEAEGYIDSGFKALKIKIGKNISFDKTLIKQIRSIFPDIKLMADANHAYDINEAVIMEKLLEENNYSWFEEPLSPNPIKLILIII